MHSNNIIILHRDFENLKKDVEKLRIELSMLVFERDELLYQECKNIETAYMLAVGALEYKAYELECAMLRLKRKVELIQARKNRQEKIIIASIEKTLDAEFAEYQTKLNEQIDKMNAALERSHGRVLSKEDQEEFKKLYRMIIKALHPDLHPDLSDVKIKLFHNAVVAYECGDLNGLKIIYAMVSEVANPIQPTDGITFLKEEKERLTGLLQSIKNGIAEIKSEYPYTMKSLVQNPEALESKKIELTKHIEQLTEALSAYAARIEEMLGRG